MRTTRGQTGIPTEAVNMPLTATEKLLTQHGIQQSMSRKGSCWDNTVSESFFHTLKTECVNHEHYATHEIARKSIFDYIEVFYNRQRLHSNNGYS